MPAATRRRKAAFVGILAPMRSLLAALAALWLAGCSVISVDLTPRVRPLEEETVEGHGHDEILMMDVSGFISDESPGSALTIGTPPARVPLLVRVREELKKAHKDMGSPFRALTPQERAIFQSVIDDLQRQFVAKVVERRKIPATAAAALADGRIYTAQQALGHQLVDRLGYIEEAVEVARRAA